MSGNGKIKVGIIGFGLSGKSFHTPLLLAQGGFKIDVVCSSDVAKVHLTLPLVQVVADPFQLINSPKLDLVVIAAPNLFHFRYAEAALKSGKHVVIEKPFVNSVKDGKSLIELAQNSGKHLSVFHNRRWDADFLTIHKLIKSGRLGQIKHFESHFDRWRPKFRPERWREQSLEGSGLLYDLGTHLIDQALVLFGRPDSVTADICSQKEGTDSDDFFHLILRYGTTRVVLQSSSFIKTSPRFQVFGDRASYVKFGLDPQEEQMKQGVSILSPSFGIEEKDCFGELSYPSESNSETFQIEKIQSEKGSYLNYYDLLYQKIVTGAGCVPVSALEALNVIEIIEFAFQSAREGRTIFLPASPSLGGSL